MTTLRGLYASTHPMIHSGTIADFVVFVHLLYMGYAIIGQLLILIGWPLGWKWIRNPWFRGSHLAMILLVAIEGVQQFECPLTTWEKDLRKAAGQNFEGTEKDEESGISFTGRLMRQVQFAGNNWEEIGNTPFYIAAGVVVLTFLLVPPRNWRLVAGVNLLLAALAAGILLAMTGNWNSAPAEQANAPLDPRWLLLAMAVCVIGGVFALLPRKGNVAAG